MLSAPLLVLAVFGALASNVSPAQAAKLHFGTQEYLRPIQDVDIRGPNGEELYLGHKYSFHSFIMPYSLSDDGYILGVKGRDAYFRLDKATTERFQASGHLPTPLPAYEISTLDYAMGHLLWGLPFLVAALVAIDMLRRKQRRERRQRATPFFESALQHGKNGDIDRAIADYTKAIQIDPHFEAAVINRGANHERKGDYERAILDFTRAIKLGPASVTVLGLINRGLAYEKKGELDSAIADYTQAIKAGQSAGAYFNRGNALMGKGDYASAIADYSKAIELEPNSAAAYQARSNAYAKQGDAALARADQVAALEIGLRGAMDTVGARALT